MAKKDLRPIANPSLCIASLERYMETQTLLRGILPNVIESLRETKTDYNSHLANLLEQHNKALQSFHDNYI